MGRFFAMAAALVAALSVAASAVAATPPTLTGEFLTGNQPSADTCSFGGGTVSWDLSGAASGPYAGTFTETLTIDYGPVGTDGLSPITSGSATFTITTADSTVTGTKAITDGTVDCTGEGSFFGSKFGGTYSATISAPGGGFHDEGTIDGGGSGGSSVGGASESFFSSLPAPTPLGPTSTSDCKQGGWQSLGIFKNQGDCVSFVATGGKNQPG